MFVVQALKKSNFGGILHSIVIHSKNFNFVLTLSLLGRERTDVSIPPKLKTFFWYIQCIWIPKNTFALDTERVSTVLNKKTNNRIKGN